jgi:opacity protein-like surface antigen
MLKAVTGMAVLGIALAGTPARAQDAKMTVDVTAGYAFSDGVSGDSYLIPGVGTFDRVDPKDGFKWGLGIGALMGEHGEVGFLFGQQLSKLQIGGSRTIDVGDMKVNTYHGYFAYNFGDRATKIRPYIMGGLGATNYGSVDYVGPLGNQGTIDGTTKFSWTWGGGVKLYMTPRVAARAGMQWTPTYINTQAAGWWCDPFWGCYVVGSAKYANQVDFSGGLTFRF